MADQDTQYRTAWLLTNDQEFLRQNLTVKAEVYPRGSLRYIAHLATLHYRKNHALLTKDMVYMITETDQRGLQRAGATKEQVRRVFDVLSETYHMTEDERVVARGLCREWLERRTVVVAMEKAGVAVNKGDMEAARTLLEGARLSSASAKGTSIQLSGKSEDFLRRMRQKLPGAIPTGLYDLDKLWDGGFRPGELGMVVAPTGVGKSMVLAMLAAETFWRGGSVLYYTYELTPEQIRDRIALAILECGKREAHGEWQDELAAAAERKGQSIPAGIIDVRNDAQTWPDINMALEEFKRQHGAYPDTLLLDSADDVAPLRGRSSRWEQLLEAFVYLRLEIAEAKQIRVWTSGQLNREAVDKARINLKNMGDAFAKAQKSHYVLGMSQGEADKNYDTPRMHVFVLKDSLHGTTRSHLECQCMWGFGDNGYADLVVDKTHQLPVASESDPEEDDDD